MKRKVKEFLTMAKPDMLDRGFLQIIGLLDSIKGGRFYKDVIYQPISEANKEYMVEDNKYIEKDKKFLESVFKKKGTLLDLQIGKLAKQVYVEDIDLWFTSLEMIDIYNSTRATENLEAMKKQGIYIGGQDVKRRVFHMTDKAIESISKTMSKESKQIADYMWKNIKDIELTNKMNKAYIEKYNKPFPYTKGGYWAMRRRYMGSKQRGGDIFNPEYSQKTVLSPKSFIKRVKNDNPLIISDGWMKYIKGRTDILKFISYDKALMNAKSVIMSRDFKSEFIEKYGGSSYRHLLNSFDVTANGLKSSNDVMAKGADYIRQTLSVAFIGAKSRNVLSQGTSFVASIAEISVADFSKGLGKFIVAPRKGYRLMMRSPLIRLRHKRANFSRGLFEADVRKFKKYGFSMTNTAMFFTKVGDMTGVIGAAYTTYDYNFNKYTASNMGRVEADKRAMQDAENFVISTQQSALPELKNFIMQQHPYIRIAGSFQQAQEMYRAKGYEAVNTWINSGNKWSKKNFEKMAKRVFTYHFALPALYELSRGNINPISLISRTVFSPISGFMGYGKIIEYAICTAILGVIIPLLLGRDDKKWKDMLPFDPSTLIGEAKYIYQRTIKSANDWIKGEANKKDAENLTDTALMFLRIPAKNLREEYAKFNDIFTGEDTSILRLLQTKWQSEQRKPKPKGKYFK